MKLESKLRKSLERNDESLLQETYAEIYDAYHGLVAFVIADTLRSKSDVEDLVNDVFLSFFSFPRKMEIRSIKSFLATSSRNAAFDHLKKMPSESLEEEMAISENPMSSFVLELKEYLSEDEMALLYDYYVYELSAKEIAKARKTSPANIRMQVMRLRKRLKERFGGNRQ